MFVELPHGDMLPVESIQAVLVHPTTETRRLVRNKTKEDPLGVISFFKPRQKKGSLVFLHGGMIVLLPISPRIIVNRINKVLGIGKADDILEDLNDSS